MGRRSTNAISIRSKDGEEILCQDCFFKRWKEAECSTFRYIGAKLVFSSSFCDDCREELWVDKEVRVKQREVTMNCECCKYWDNKEVKATHTSQFPYDNPRPCCEKHAKIYKERLGAHIEKIKTEPKKEESEGEQ